MTCLNRKQEGGILSWCGKKDDFCNIDKYTPKCKYKKEPIRIEIKREIEYEQSSLYNLGENDGKPILNAFQQIQEIKKERLLEKERKIIQEYQEQQTKAEMEAITNATDDFFDSKGQDITKKEYLQNEKEGVFLD